MARDAGARGVYFASPAAPVRYPNVYGIDMPSADELVGHGRTEAEIGEAIGADRLIYQNLDDLVAAVRRGNPRIPRLDTSVFSGEYVTGDVSEAYLAQLASRRGDSSERSGDEDPEQEALEVYGIS